MADKTELGCGLMVWQGNRLEDLRDLVQRWLAHQPLAPLENEVFLVQSQGMGQWLKLALAGDTGVSAAVSMQLPAQFLWQAYRRVLGDAAVPERSALDRETGLLRMQQAGATLVTREMVLFETLRQAGTDLFRHMSRRYLIEDAPLANSRVFDALRQSQVRGKCFADILALLPRPHGALRLRGICGTEADVLLDDLPGQSGSWKVYGYLLRHFDGEVGKDAAQAGLVLYAEHVADAREHPGKHPNIDRLLAIVAGRGAVLGCV